MSLSKDDVVIVVEPNDIPRNMIVRELPTNVKNWWEFESTDTGNIYVVSVGVVFRIVPPAP